MGIRIHTGAMVVGLGVARLAGAAEADCTALAQPGQFGTTEIRSARAVAADAATGAPAHCEVTAVLKPVPGSQIVAVYRLPETWNGRMLGLGGGGWAGNVLLAPGLPALTRGYATAQTDGGHPSANALDTSWTKNPIAVTDFSHRAIHETAVFGKQLVAKRYGKAATHNYYQGCSTGGRMGFMETQRYPEDYEGVIAGAPVYTLLTQTSPVIRHQIFSAPGAAFSAELLAKVNGATTAACDALDGATDGVITDPRRCNWDPASMRCKTGQTEGCLTDAQVKALNEIYATRRSSAGVVANYGLTRGSEAGWSRFIAAENSTPLNPLNGGLMELIPLIFPDGKYDPATFGPEQQAAVHRTPFAREYEASSTDLGPFFKRGGKLLVWHGFDDPGPSAFATIDWVERAVKANGPDNLQFFVAPGVYHCGGGPGADSFDLLSAMENWVEKGQKPTRITAKNTKTGDTRPLCPWPALPYHAGNGDTHDEHNFACRVMPSPTRKP